jgi:hypothetical protein
MKTDVIDIIRNQPFGQGQLYVEFSRVRSEEGITVLSALLSALEN